MHTLFMKIGQGYMVCLLILSACSAVRTGFMYMYGMLYKDDLKI